MTRRFPPIVLLAAMVFVLAAAITTKARQTPAQQTRPTFEGGVDLMQLDVSVLDAKRQPVKGLTAADFTILEDGKARTVETLVEIDVPRPLAATTEAGPVWQDAVPRDVFSSETSETAKRVVVVVIDDNSLQRSDQGDALVLAKTREVARRAIADLGKHDLAAIVYASNNFSAQSLTSDHQRLLAAIERATLTPGSVNDDPTAAVDRTGAESGECWCNLCSVNVLDDISRAVGAIPNLRKTVLFVSAGIVPAPACQVDYMRAMDYTARDAALANVNVHAFDPTGLKALPAGAGRLREVSGDYRVAARIDPRTEFLRAIAESTGGTAIVNNNDPDRRVSDVLAATRSYYLLGFQPANLTPDGKLRKLRVVVNRNGVTVEARNGYVVPVADARAPAPAIRNTQEIMPGAAFPLEASAAVFAELDGKPRVAVTLGIHAPGATLTAGPMQVVGRVVDVFGGARGTMRQTLTFPGRGGPTPEHREVASTMPLPAGRYDIRLAVEAGDGQTSGVHVPIEIPDFLNEPLAASSLVLRAGPLPDVVPRDMADLTPVVPGTQRVFAADDIVTAFLRVYPEDARESPTVRIDVLDAAGDVVAADDRVLNPNPYGRLFAADCLYDIPVRRLTPGDYLLSMDVKVGKRTIQRAIRFAVR